MCNRSLLTVFLLAMTFTQSGSLLLGQARTLVTDRPQEKNSDSQNPDRLVDIGGRRLHIKCIGTGAPIVVLEAGLGGDLDTWYKVMPQVGKFTRVCAYDRPNEGDSDPAPRSLQRIGSRTYLELRTGEQLTDDLHQLLIASGEKGPYVLVGNSFGGLLIILYAAQYPAELAGMVLVDSSHEDMVARITAFMTAAKAQRFRDILAQNEDGIDIEQISEKLRANHWRTTAPLYVLAQGRATKPLPGWSPENWAKRQQAWREMQIDHAQRSPNGKLIIAEKSGHMIQFDQPELVVDAIKQMLTVIRINREQTRQKE